MTGSYLIVRQAFCGHYTETTTFGPFATREEAEETSREAGRFGTDDAIVKTEDYRRQG